MNKVEQRKSKQLIEHIGSRRRGPFCTDGGFLEGKGFQLDAECKEKETGHTWKLQSADAKNVTLKFVQIPGSKEKAPAEKTMEVELFVQKFEKVAKDDRALGCAMPSPPRPSSMSYNACMLSHHSLHYDSCLQIFRIFTAQGVVRIRAASMLAKLSQLPGI